MVVSSKEKMKQFLSAQALKIREESNCKVCGSRTQSMMTTFTFGDDES
jgi:ribosomal protein S14